MKWEGFLLDLKIELHRHRGGVATMQQDEDLGSALTGSDCMEHDCSVTEDMLLGLHQQTLRSRMQTWWACLTLTHHHCTSEENGRIK